MTATPDFIVRLAETGAMAPTADNGQACYIDWDGRTLGLAYAQRHAASNVFGPDSHGTLLGIGAVAENISAALAANGRDAPWQWAEAADQPYGSLALPSLPAQFLAPAGPAARHTNRFPYRKAALPPALLEKLAASSQGSNRVAVLSDAASIKRLVRQVRISAEARFCNPALHRWLFDCLRRTPEEVARGDGLDMRTLGLPPGGAALMRFIADWERMAALNRFGMYKLMALAEVGQIAAAPALVCIAGGRARRDVLEAGRLLVRVWSEINLAGVAVQPFYVVSDQLNRLHEGILPAGFERKISAVEAEVGQLLALAPGQQLHMILRVGYPTVEPVRSRRLPLDQVLRYRAFSKDLASSS